MQKHQLFTKGMRKIVHWMLNFPAARRKGCSTLLRRTAVIKLEYSALGTGKNGRKWTGSTESAVSNEFTKNTKWRESNKQRTRIRIMILILNQNQDHDPASQFWHSILDQDSESWIWIMNLGSGSWIWIQNPGYWSRIPNGDSWLQDPESTIPD